MIEVHGLDAWHGKQQCLFNINLDIQSHKITSILGTNGAGKSSLVQSLLGNVHNTGSIYLKDKNKTTALHTLKTHQRVQKGLVLIPEGRQLFPKMSVLDHLLIPLMYRYKDGLLKLNQLKQIFPLFPILEERQQQSAQTLSGGEQQMLAIARGLLLNPKILILDEPSFGLSPKISKEVFNTIQTLNQRGLTILIIEQNVQATLKFSHFTYFLESGRLSQVHSGDQLKHRPNLLQSYLGEMIE